MNGRFKNINIMKKVKNGYEVKIMNAKSKPNKLKEKQNGKKNRKLRAEGH